MAEDPSFALPMAYAAWWHCLWIGQGWAADPVAETAKAFDLAGRAIALDPANALALAAQGHMLSFLRRQYGAAMVFFDRALEACPSSAFAWMWSSGTLAYLGRGEEAVERAEQALRLSPLDQARYLYDTRLGLAHYANGDLEAAVELAGEHGRKIRTTPPTCASSPRRSPRLGNGSKRRQSSLTFFGWSRTFGFPPMNEGLQPFTHPTLRERFLGDLRAAGVPP